MVLFIDSSKLDEVKYFASWGIVAGVTTNPKIIASEGQATLDGLREQIQAICEQVPEGGTCSMEVLAETTAAMVTEGKQYHAWNPAARAAIRPATRCSASVTTCWQRQLATRSAEWRPGTALTFTPKAPPAASPTICTR